MSFLICTQAQEKTMSTNFGMGFHLNQYQNDFGIGLNITSPFFIKESIAIRVRGNFMFNEHVQDSSTTWSPYSNFTAGVVGVGGKIGEFIRLYGEGGVIFIIPSSEFSSSNLEIGGYGLFGFEFYMAEKHAYYIEIGGAGTGAVADKVENKPIYSNGLIISVGYRLNF